MNILDDNPGMKDDEKKLGESDTGLNWGDFLTRLSPENTALIQENEFGLTSESYKKLTKAGFNALTTKVDARYHPEFVDKEIRGVVAKIDQLPFVKSNNGCSGHSIRQLKSSLQDRRKDPDDLMSNPKYAEEWEAIMGGYSEAYLSLYFDEKDARSYRFLDTLLEPVIEFAKGHRDLFMRYSFWKEDDKKGVSTFRMKWEILIPDNWLKNRKGMEDLPNPATLDSKQAEEIIEKRHLEYPYENGRTMKPWILYNHIYGLLYHDFYKEQEGINQAKLQEVFALIQEVAEEYQGEPYDGKIVAIPPEKEAQKYPYLKEALDKLQKTKDPSDWSLLP